MCEKCADALSEMGVPDEIISSVLGLIRVDSGKHTLRELFDQAMANPVPPEAANPSASKAPDDSDYFKRMEALKLATASYGNDIPTAAIIRRAAGFYNYTTRGVKEPAND